MADGETGRLATTRVLVLAEIDEEIDGPALASAIEDTLRSAGTTTIQRLEVDRVLVPSVPVFEG